MALNTLVDSLLLQSERCETERVSCGNSERQHDVNVHTPPHMYNCQEVQPSVL